MSDIAEFLGTQYNAIAVEHIETEHGCMRCGDDWPCYPIRDIESKRRIVEEIAPKLEEMWRIIAGEWGDAEDLPDGDDLLKILAAPFAGEPGYDERWRP